MAAPALQTAVRDAHTVADRRLLSARPIHDARTASDVHLMVQAGAGNLSAQRRVMERLMGRVQRLTRSWFGRSADASDASQTSLLNILRSASNFRGESTLERWADRIVVRTLLRIAEGRRERARTLEPSTEPTVAEAADPAVVVNEYLSRLSETARTILILRHGFEHSIEEIAELTGVSPNTAKDRLLRARHAVRDMRERDRLRAEHLAVRIVPSARAHSAGGQARPSVATRPKHSQLR